MNLRVEKIEPNWKAQEIYRGLELGFWTPEPGETYYQAQFSLESGFYSIAGSLAKSTIYFSVTEAITLHEKLGQMLQELEVEENGSQNLAV